VQQKLFEEYCSNDDINTTLLKVDIMQRMCMCGFLRDAIKPQTELHSIQSSELNIFRSSGVSSAMIPCINFRARTKDQSYPCENIYLLSFLNLADISKAFNSSMLSSQSASMVWGYVDDIGNEIGMIGTYLGLSFVDVTVPTNPTYLGTLEPPSNGGYSFWRDVRVYKNYIYTVTENGCMQYMDMNVLINLRNTNQIPTNGLLLKQYASEFGNNSITKTHTININTRTGFAYLVGSNLCEGGLYMVNITTPDNPSYAGCFDDDGYTHEVQCTCCS
jgi:choice-of-anchor B domain-containing protein